MQFSEDIIIWFLFILNTQTHSLCSSFVSYYVRFKIFITVLTINLTNSQIIGRGPIWIRYSEYHVLEPSCINLYSIYFTIIIISILRKRHKIILTVHNNKRLSILLNMNYFNTNESKTDKVPYFYTINVLYKT